MTLTWLSIAASLCMGMAAILLFLHAVKKDWFRDIEDAKYQVFWSDLEAMVDQPRRDASGVPESQNQAGIHEAGVHEEKKQNGDQPEKP